MYIPGRRRTGSRPSRTVMSFAEYDAFAGDFAIKGNACKTTVLRAAESVSDRAVRGVASQPQTGRFLHGFAQVLILDLRGDLGSEAEIRRRRRLRGGRPGCRRGRGELTRREPHLGHAEPCRDLGGTMAELERPHRIGSRDVHGAVAGNA